MKIILFIISIDQNLINQWFSEDIKGENTSDEGESSHSSQLAETPNVVLAGVEPNVVGLVNELSEVVERWTHLATGCHAEDWRSVRVTVSTCVVISNVRSDVVSSTAVFSAVPSASHSVFRVALFEIVVFSILVVRATKYHVFWIVVIIVWTIARVVWALEVDWLAHSLGLVVILRVQFALVPNVVVKVTVRVELIAISSSGNSLRQVIPVPGINPPSTAAVVVSHVIAGISPVDVAHVFFLDSIGEVGVATEVEGEGSAVDDFHLGLVAGPPDVVGNRRCRGPHNVRISIWSSWEEAAGVGVGVRVRVDIGIGVGIEIGVGSCRCRGGYGSRSGKNRLTCNCFKERYNKKKRLHLILIFISTNHFTWDKKRL
jgi:hypothetical protein